MIRQPESGELVACSSWETCGDSTSEDRKQAQRERETSSHVQGLDFTAYKEFRRMQAECHGELIEGQSHICLHMLAVSPHHQHQGIGSAMLKWGLDKADDKGMPVCLEASRAGRKLYERWGFLVKKVLPFDARKYGHTDAAEHYCMRGEPTR